MVGYRALLSTLCFFVLFWVLISGCISGPATANKQSISDGTSLYREGKYNEAIQSFDKYLQSDSTSSDAAFAWWLRSLSCDGLGREEEALTSIDHAISISPRDPNFWGTKEQILYKLSRFTEADEAAEKVMILTANYPATPVPTTTRPTATTQVTMTPKIVSPAPTPALLTAKDQAFLDMLSRHRDTLYSLSLKQVNITWFEYEAFGQEFISTVDGLNEEMLKNIPDDPTLRQAWNLYGEALQYFASAGQAEEQAGAGFSAGDYSLASERLHEAIDDLGKGNTNLNAIDNLLKTQSNEPLTATTETILTTVIISPTPLHTTPLPTTLTAKDQAFLDMLSRHREILYSLSLKQANLTWFEYEAFGQEFGKTVEDLKGESIMNKPDNLTFCQASALYDESLQSFAVAGQEEEMAGRSFSTGDYSTASAQLQGAVNNLDKGNRNLARIDELLRNLTN
jgi:tetratricopeptide (TPR) repeat protein